MLHSLVEHILFLLSVSVINEPSVVIVVLSGLKVWIINYIQS